MGTYLLDDPHVRGVVVHLKGHHRAQGGQKRRLREAEERYRTLVEQIPAVTYIDEIDETELRHLYEPTGRGYVRLHARGVAGGPELWIKHPPSRRQREGSGRGLANQRDRRDRFRMEYRMISKSGHVVWVGDEAVLVRDEGG